MHCQRFPSGVKKKIILLTRNDFLSFWVDTKALHQINTKYTKEKLDQLEVN